MPLAFAFIASALIHAAALVGPGWIVPGMDDPDPPPAIEAVLVRPAVRAEPVSAVRPLPKPATAKPRSASVATPVAGGAGTETAGVQTPAAVPPPDRPEAPPAAAAPVTDTSAPAPQPAKSALPARGRVRYAITRGEGGFVIGQSVHTWEHDGFAYQLQSVTETTGLAALFKPARVVQISRGEVSAEGLRPREFRHERVGGLDTANFDWARRVVAYAGREENVAAGAQDMLSMYYQLVLLAPKSAALEMPIATGRKLENYRFDIVGEEPVALPAGERRALRLKTRSGNDTIEVWLDAGKGAEMRGLPLKIRFTDRKGEIFDQLADDIDIRENQ